MLTIQESRIVHASGAEVANGNAESVLLSRQGAAYLDVTAASGTTPTLDVFIEEYDAASDSWFVIGTFAQLVAAGSERIDLAFVANSRVRARWVIAGTTPSFTFSVGINAKENNR